MPEQPEIPDLKKKEKERKKGGVLWRGGGGGSAPFSGATGGAGIARAAASAAAMAEAAGDAAMEESAGWLSRLLSTFLAPFERLAATWAGKFALAAFATALIGGAAMLARVANERAAGSPAAGVGSADGSGLGAIASSIKIHTGSDSGLDYAAKANKGALANGQAPAAPQKPAQASKAQDADKGAAQDQQQAQAQQQALDNANIQANQQHLAHNMSGTRLSTSFGADFGNHNIFAGAAKLGHGFSPSSLAAMLSPLTSHGKASSTHPATPRAGRVGRGRRGIGMSNSFGQLLTMGGMNGTMLTAGTQEGAGQTASDQWQLQQTQGGAPPTTPITGGGANPGGVAGAGGGVPSIPGGSGAGSCTNPGEIFDGTSCVPMQNPNGVDATPWASAIGAAMGLINAAVAMIMMASMVFTALWITSLILKANMWTHAIGIALGIAAIAFATMMTAMAMMMGGQIQQLGQIVSAAGSPILGNQLASIGGMIKSMAWVSITGIGGMILAMMILMKESQVLSTVGQQSDAGTSDAGGAPQGGTPAPAGGSSGSPGP